jgi:dipeptidyl aminopeptidase/acylaminoacyl peptidase
MFAKRVTAVCALLIVTSNALAADDPKKKDDKKKWDVEAPLGPTQTIEFTTDEGTWMNLDVSPDGKQIAFDLLGDIYLMPVTGGKATLLRGGPAFEVQPRFSPDGKRISYTSDKDGADNVWIMDRDGSNPKQVTKEDFRLVNNAVWTHALIRRSFRGGAGRAIRRRCYCSSDVGMFDNDCVPSLGRAS